jgi:[protein-PII] uridylyltransferase
MIKTEAIKETLAAKRAEVRAFHDAGGSGCAVSARLCAVVDEVVTTLLGGEAPGRAGALVALGGYGRGLLNPFSDVDLLFLLPDGVEPPHGMLAQLWDLGLTVGHSARTIADTINMGLADLTARTAMIESRFLAGDRELYDAFRKKYAHKVIHHRPDLFVQAKSEEMRRRRLANGRYAKLTEPNLKESPGGLRDFHTALWCVAAKTGALTLEEMVAKGVMSPEDFEPVAAAHCRLMRIRNALHFKVGKGMDTLSHPYQADIARGEGFVDGSDNLVAAELMREYYAAAVVVKRFAHEMIDYAANYKRFRWFRSVHVDNDGLMSDGRKLYAKGFPPQRYDERPTILFRIARRMSEEGLEEAPNLFRGLKRLCREAPDGWFVGPEAGRLLMAVLKLRHAAGPIKLFHAAGILTRMIPEFAAVTDLSQFDMFHRYSVDEHILHTIRKLEDIPEGATVNDRMRHHYRAASDLEVTKLALLLHDIGKRAEDRHAVEEDTHTGPILDRLGLDRYFDCVHFLVERHLLMSNTGQRLDFTEPATLVNFCRQVGGAQNLRRLYLLTYADIAGVGPGVWNEWKDKILLDLFDRADRWFLEGDAVFASAAEQVKKLAELTVAADPSLAIDRVERFLASGPERYVFNIEPALVADDMAMVERLATGVPAAIRYVSNPGDASGELTLAAKSGIGFFATVAGAFTAKNINVVQAQIHTFEPDLAIDTFTVTGSNLSLFSDLGSLARFEKEMGELLTGAKQVAELVARRTRYMTPAQTGAAVDDEPHVVIVNHLSDTSTVIEIWAGDRIGLLFDITRTLAELALDINSAKISTEGPRAINVFYVTTATGEKIVDPAEQERIAQALKEAMVAYAPAG